MMNDWTDEESQWIRKAIRLFRRKPPTVDLYTTDGEISACKRGVPSTSLWADVADSGSIMACGYLSDHEDIFNRGAVTGEAGEG